MADEKKSEKEEAKTIATKEVLDALKNAGWEDELAEEIVADMLKATSAPKKEL